MTQRFRWGVALAGLSLAATSVVVPFTAGPAAAESNTLDRLVPASDSAGARYSSGTLDPHVSGDGRWLAFTDGTGVSYVKDLLTDATTVVSVNQSGVAANAFTDVVAIDQDGSRVLFTTAATNMGGDPATSLDLWVRDLPGHTTTRVNELLGSNPIEVSPGSGGISDDGNVVVFAGTGANSHVWERNLLSDADQQLDVNSGGFTANGPASTVAVSGDGTHFAFTSKATDLGGPATTHANVYERTLTAGSTARVSLGIGSVAGTGDSSVPVLSRDGRYVAFESSANNLVAGDDNHASDVFRTDTTDGTTILISQATDGTAGDGFAEPGDISADGNLVAFDADVTTFATGVGNQAVYSRNVTTGTTDLVNVGTEPTSAATPVGFGIAGTTSDDGRGIAFAYVGPDLVPGSTSTHADVYVRRPEDYGPFDAGDPIPGFVDRNLIDFGHATNGINTGEAQAAITAIQDGRFTPTHYVTGLAHSSPWNTDREPVARLYQAFFRREPDLSGLNHWVNKHKAGSNLTVIASNFAASTEFKRTYGNLSNTNFVKLIYQNVLLRSADSAGLNHWVAKLDGGMHRGDVMVQFSQDAEGIRKLAPQVDSVLIGLGMLRKMPSASDYAGAVAAWQATGVPEGAVEYYLGSATYAALNGDK